VRHIYIYIYIYIYVIRRLKVKAADGAVGSVVRLLQYVEQLKFIE
jgi:hypothetical protein